MGEVERDVLREARVAAGLDVSQIAARTRLSAAVVAHIDRGEFEQLPAGIYARSYVRAYANAVGLDGDSLVKVLHDYLPAAPDPLAALATIELPVVIAPPFITLPQSWRAYAIAIVDGLFLIALDVVVVWVAALVCGVRVGRLLSAAGLPIGFLFATLAALYYVLLGAIAHRTLGARVLDGLTRGAMMAAIPSTAPSSSHDPDTVFRETVVG